MEKLPEQILATRKEDEVDKLLDKAKRVEELEKQVLRLKNSLAVLGNKERLQRDSRQYRMFLAIFDGMAATGQFNPEELAKRGGMARVELLIKHAMGISEHGCKHYREAKTDKHADSRNENPEEE
jgi:hypothetical protein